MLHRFITSAVLAAVLLPGWEVTAQGAGNRNAAAQTDAGWLYDRFCLACHGTYGDGKGPGAPWLWPRPRDFTRGEYKWRSTASGAPPTDRDLAAAIRYGVPGTSMHGFGATLSESQIKTLVAYIKRFAARAFRRKAAPVAIGKPQRITGELINRGQQMYTQLGCAACHGADGKGNGPAAAGLRALDGDPAPPYDLTSYPLRRPRTPQESALVAIYKSLLTGLSGTPMPSYASAASARDLWAVAAYVDSIRYRAESPSPRRNPTLVHPIAEQLDRQRRLTIGGYWPGRGPDEEKAVFGATIPLQGQPPATLAPAQASLDAAQCARCHAKQLREWRDSFHASAGSPGLIGQVMRLTGRGAAVESCQRCHAPLAEQLPVLRPGQRGGDDRSREYTANPRFDDDLRRQGINCAGCHVRNWQRLGPPRTSNSDLLDLPSYPTKEVAIYERSDFCLGCHQLPPRGALAGKPLLNTYREWLEGPYMRRGIQCQHCHMPNREHTWKGVHDPETFRQGMRVEAIAGRSTTSGAVSVRARAINVGAGHYLPTTPTPAAWLSIELVDRDGKRIPGAYAEKRIGRYLKFERRFIEVEDTRIPPGESLELAAAWKEGAVDEAVAVKISVRVAPDDYYEGLYRARLQAAITPEVRALFEQALRQAEASRYVAIDKRIPIRPITGAKAAPKPAQPSVAKRGQ